MRHGTGGQHGNDASARMAAEVQARMAAEVQALRAGQERIERTMEDRLGSLNAKLEQILDRMVKVS